MSDLSAPEVCLWHSLEERARRVFDLFGFREVRTPLVEKAALFERSLGDGSDVVRKEMYRFPDRGGRELALRPEGTAGVIRHAASSGPEAQRLRLFYCGPMFRAERPQAGRRRQFHQVGVESLGSPSPAMDAECVTLQSRLLQAWGVENFEIRINSRGAAGDRENLAAALRRELEPRKDRLCADCNRRWRENVLRVLDCKQEACRGIVSELPPMTSLMSGEARDYFNEVLAMLQAMECPVTIDPMLVRGLDYYEQTVWEVRHAMLGAQDSISGGGRYRILQGDREIAGVGFAVGMERVVAALLGQGVDPGQFASPPAVCVATQGQAAFIPNMTLAMNLRERGWSCLMDLTGRSLKAQMRGADRAGARWVIVRGDREIENDTYLLKDMAGGGEQQSLRYADLLRRLQDALG